MSVADTSRTEDIAIGEPADASQHAHNTATPHHNPSPLLRLPPELRNRIYNYALFQGNIQLFSGWTADRRPTEKPDLELLRTCRQIHCEASQIVHTINTFEFLWTFDIPRFARSLTARDLNVVRSIRLQRESINSLVNVQGGVDAICMLPSLEELHFRGHLCGPGWDQLAMTRLRADGKSISIFAD